MPFQQKYNDFRNEMKKFIEYNQTYIHSLRKNKITNKLTGIKYDQEFIDKIHNQYNPVFVLSTGRCGTQYLSAILEVNPYVDVQHKPVIEAAYHSKIAYMTHEDQHECLKQMIDIARLELIMKSFYRNRRYVETNNRITFFAYAIADLFPNSKFIHLVRHPASFVRSGIRRGWYTDKDNLNFARIYQLEKDRDWSNMSQISKIAWLWDETNCFIEDFKNSIKDQNRLLFIRAEDMFGNISVIENIFQFINIPVENEKVIRKKIGKIVNEQKTGQFPNYSDWSTQQKTEFSQYLTLHTKYDYKI